jgi:peptidoglycan/LPS O-acetylase OafA/YrhL
MATHAPTSHAPDAALKRERMLSMIAGALGVLMFVWGFLRWLNVDDGSNQHKYSGYAFQMPTTAVVGFSLAAGLMALLGAMERRPGRGVPSAVPTALAATGLLLALGVFLGKGAISPDFGGKVGVEIGLILALITAALQTIVLGMVLASRHDDRDDRVTDAGRTSAYPTHR